jgi:glutamine amidotransferase
MVAIVDYGMGNLLSVLHAVQSLGADVCVCASPEELGAAERVILPGVGAFPQGMKNLHARGWLPALEKARAAGKPILGICLGMQLMASRGFEGAETKGLGWIEGDVVRLTPPDRALRVPHLGWNEVAYAKGSRLFRDLPAQSDFYFVHSYHLQCRKPENVEATTDYGGQITAAVRAGNVCGTQFHPEKSQGHGLAVFTNFLRGEAGC